MHARPLFFCGLTLCAAAAWYGCNDDGHLVVVTDDDASTGAGGSDVGGSGGSEMGGSGSGIERLDPSTLEKFVDPVARPVRVPGFEAGGQPGSLVVGMFEVMQQLHSSLPPTRVWGYGLSQIEASYPGPTLDVRPGIATDVRWENNLPANHMFTVDTTIHWASPEIWPGAGVPTVVHVHGGLQEAAADGYPEAWFTPAFEQTGPGFVDDVSHYVNQNEEELLWYHDHALGITRLNVYAGLAGFYLLRDPAHEAALGLPSGPYDLELLFQDRAFQSDGSLFYPSVGDNPDVHPNWVPEFFGDVNLVNGVVWPHFEVEPRRYHFRLLNGANARFYSLKTSDNTPFIQIGSDGGFLEAPVVVHELLLAPGERADVIMDFTGKAEGASIRLTNSAPAPYPGGDAVDENTAAVMEFRVVALQSPDTSSVPVSIDTIPTLGPPDRVRTLTLIESEDPDTGQPVGVWLDGKRWGPPGSVTELPQVGSTEVWEIVNLTMDAHPIHIHLIDFQIVNRQLFDVDAYRAEYLALYPDIPTNMAMAIPVEPFLMGAPTPPAANEAGWKDTFVVPPGMVSRLIVQWGPEPGGDFPFDATAEPGYVWHCHILEHEDNEMMRPFRIGPEQWGQPGSM